MMGRCAAALHSISLDVDEQEAMIADLDAISRRRALSTQESDWLADLLRRAEWRKYMRARRRQERIDRLQRQLQRLAAA